jgi:excisionase family DNA binding protein
MRWSPASHENPQRTRQTGDIVVWGAVAGPPENIVAEAKVPESQKSNARMSIPEIARRLAIGRLAVYSMLEQGLLPGIRLGRRWIVTRYAYEEWERTCGVHSESGSTKMTGAADDGGA